MSENPSPRQHSMLSSGRGLQKRSKFLGLHRTKEARVDKLCPYLKTKGFCRAYNVEEAMRQDIIAEKNAQLLQKAEELFALEVEMNGVQVQEESEQAHARHIERYIDELKKEKEYENWNLELEVSKRMRTQSKRRCFYSHRGEVSTTLRVQDRKSDASYEQRVQELARNMRAPVTGGHTEPAASSSPARNYGHDVYGGHLAARRHLIYHRLSPFQKLTVLLLEENVVHVPQKLVCDVEKMLLEKREENGDELAEGEEDAIDPAELEREEERRVALQVFDPLTGIVDLSHLPKILPYTAQHLTEVISSHTVKFFTGADGSPKIHIDEKNIDLSREGCVQELLEAIRWVLSVESSKRQSTHNLAKNSSADAKPAAAASSSAVPLDAFDQAGGLILRGLSLRCCNIVNGEALVSGMRKHRLQRDLLLLDLSNNRLESLHLLFHLRANFSERLLRLSLKNNPITRKPEYREQVRRMLPRLVALDGEPIRRPPLTLPHPTQSPAVQGGSSSAGITEQEKDRVMGAVSRLFYAWETRHVPILPQEIAFTRREHVDIHRREDLSYADDNDDGIIHGDDDPVLQHLRPEEEVDLDSFAKRYFHPASIFSLTVRGDCKLFREEDVKSFADAEADGAFSGLRLAPQDINDLRVFDVSVRNISRNLLMGRPVLSRFARGPLHGYTAYVSSLYPERVYVNHHHGRALVSIIKIADEQNYDEQPTPRNAVREPASGKRPRSKDGREAHVKEKKSKLRKGSSSKSVIVRPQGIIFGINRVGRKPTYYAVTLHGLMTWRSPTMRGDTCVLVAYDRTLTFVESTLPTVRDVLERLRTMKAKKRKLARLTSGGGSAPARSSAAKGGNPSVQDKKKTKKGQISKGGAEQKEPNGENLLEEEDPLALLEESQEQLATDLWAALRAPRLLLFNDQISLRPATVGDLAYYDGREDKRLLRLVIAFGLECSLDGVRLVRAVSELCSSDAATHAVLSHLLFGEPLDSSASAAGGTGTGSQRPNALSASLPAKPKHGAARRSKTSETASQPNEVARKVAFDVRSVLSLLKDETISAVPSTTNAVVHVTLEEVMDVARRANELHVAKFSRSHAANASE